MKSTLPLRFRILHYAAQVPSFTVSDLLRDLDNEYHGEGQFSPKMLAQHCDTLRAGGLIDEKDVDVTQDGNLLITYVLNEYGLSRLSYLPDEWKLK